MNSDADRLKNLWAAFLAGEPLSEKDEQALVDALRNDPDLRAECLQDAEFEGMVRALAGRGKEADSVTQGFLQALEAERGATRFLKKVETRIDESRPPTRRTRRAMPPASGGLLPFLIAAGILFAVVVFFVLSASEPAHDLSEVRRNAEKAERIQATLREERRRTAEQARKDAEARVAQLRDAEKKADAVRATAKEEDLRKKADEAFLEASRKRIAEEERLKALRDAEALAAKPEPEPAPQEKPPAPIEKPATVAATMTLERADGTAVTIAEGAGLEISGRATLRYVDQTRLEISPGTEIKELRTEKGKRMTIVRGEIRAVVARQPKNQPMALVTPHGEATVVGTTLRLIVDPDPKKGTVLVVEEGKVQLKNLAGKTADVVTGHYAVAAAGAEIAPQPIPSEEIVLTPAQGRVVGKDWKTVRDPLASVGQAFEAVDMTGDESHARLKAGTHGSLEWTFAAEPNKDYFIWIRGNAVAEPRFSHDAVIVEVPQCVLTDAPASAFKNFFGPQRAFFNGYGHRPGYCWIGGDGDNGRDEIPVQVRFPGYGRQTVKVYVSEGLFRLDTIWISATQKTRPKEDQFGPPPRRK